MMGVINALGVMYTPAQMSTTMGNSPLVNVGATMEETGASPCIYFINRVP